MRVWVGCGAAVGSPALQVLVGDPQTTRHCRLRRVVVVAVGVAQVVTSVTRVVTARRGTLCPGRLVTAWRGTLCPGKLVGVGVGRTVTIRPGRVPRLVTEEGSLLFPGRVPRNVTEDVTEESSCARALNCSIC